MLPTRIVIRAAVLTAMWGCGSATPQTTPQEQEKPSVAKTICETPKVQFSGNIPRATVMKVANQNIQGIQECVESLGNKGDSGWVAVAFSVELDGTVGTAEIQDSTLGNEQIESCMVEAAKTWRFPPPQGGEAVRITFPFCLAVGFQPSPPPEIIPNNGIAHCQHTDAELVSDEPRVDEPAAQRIASEMEALLPAMRECVGPDGGGIVRLEIIIGSSGRPTQVRPTATFKGSKIGYCAAEKVCAARFPPLERKHTFIHEFDLWPPGDE
jgi:TonB family protein